MVQLSFKQTKAEIMVRIASTLLFNQLVKAKSRIVSVREITENIQYGYTEKASESEIGPKYVRITDLKDGQVNWDTVPYCKCEEPKQYLLRQNDLIFARTGATTGKTHLFRDIPPYAVFASYLIRVRPTKEINPEYLYYFFQSDLYWSQVSSHKEGSAQPNVNGQKLSVIELPFTTEEIQIAICKFLAVVRARQDGSNQELPELPQPLTEQRRIVAHIESLAARVNEAQRLREEADIEADALVAAGTRQVFNNHSWKMISIEEFIGRENLKNGKSLKSDEQPSEVSCLRISALRNGKIDCRDTKPISITVEDAKPYIIQKDDVYIVRGNGSKDLVGRAGLVEEYKGVIIFPDLFIKVPLNTNQMLPAFFAAWWNSPAMREKIVDLAKTTSGIWKINQGHIASCETPIPPLDEQRRIVAYLDGLQAKVNAVRGLQSQSQEELDALLPSVLDRAFKGEL